METAYPVRKALQFTAEQWERVREFRFDRKISTEVEAVRRLLEIGLKAEAEKGLRGGRTIKNETEEEYVKRRAAGDRAA